MRGSGEVNALRWEDVDLDRGVVHIHRSFNRETGKEKSTKTDSARRIAIEAELRPLLHGMHEECGGRGRSSPGSGDRSEAGTPVAPMLKRAGVDRPELHATNDPTRKAITFHDLRATGITWCAVRGDDPLRIKQRAGHAAFRTTEVYIREAENLRDGFGAVVPPLPEALLARKPKPKRPRVVFGFR